MLLDTMFEDEDETESLPRLLPPHMRQPVTAATLADLPRTDDDALSACFGGDGVDSHTLAERVSLDPEAAAARLDRLVVLMHRGGVNLRYLGLLRRHVLATAEPLAPHVHKATTQDDAHLHVPSDHTGSHARHVDVAEVVAEGGEAAAQEEVEEEEEEVEVEVDDDVSTLTDSSEDDDTAPLSRPHRGIGAGWVAGSTSRNSGCGTFDEDVIGSAAWPVGVSVGAAGYSHMLTTGSADSDGSPSSATGGAGSGAGAGAAGSGNGVSSRQRRGSAMAVRADRVRAARRESFQATAGVMVLSLLPALRTV